MTDTNPGGWPDAARPGYPKDPERTGPHAFRQNHGDAAGSEYPAWWSAHARDWTLRGGATLSALGMATATYLGPCHTPAEVAALIEAARRDK